MTTVLVTERHIAADSLVTSEDGTVRMVARKKIHRVKGALCAYAGTSGLQKPIFAWYEAGADPAKVPKLEGKSWEMLAVTLEGVFRYSDDVPYPLQLELPAVIGTGGDYARAAYRACGDVHRAMQIATDMDVHSGGKIEVVEIAPALAVLVQAAE